MAKQGSRITQLDGLRAIAIGAVFIHHAFEVKILWMGVDLFFVLSGFLITGILFNQKRKTFGKYIGSFYERRAKRILPAYVIVLIITAFLFGVGWLHVWYLYIGGMNFVVPLGYFTPGTLPLWSLAVEEQFYLLWPLAVYWLDRKQLIYCASAMLVAAPVLRWVCTPLFHDHFAIYMLLPFRMDTLAAGALIALVWPELQQKLAHQGGERLRWLITGAGAVAAAVALLALRYLNAHGDTTSANTKMGNTGIFEAVLVIVTAVFLAVLLGFGKKLLSTWIFQWIGRISYSIYLIHLTALYLAPHHNVMIAVVMTLVYSVVMWFVVENPINNLGHSQPKVLVTQ